MSMFSWRIIPLLSKNVLDFYFMGCVKHNSVFEHVQNAHIQIMTQIQIMLCMPKVSSRAQLFKASLA